jgi:YD repeat-containing protein
VYEEDDQEPAFGRLIQSISASGTADEISRAFEYSLAGMVTASIDPLGRRTAKQYDYLNRLLVTTLPDPDGEGSQTAPETTYEYDAAGRLVSVTDALGNETAYEYDTLNRLVTTIYPDPDGGGSLESPETTNVYDDAGQLIATIDALGRQTDLEYDDLGRLITRIRPDRLSSVRIQASTACTRSSFGRLPSGGISPVESIWTTIAQRAPLVVAFKSGSSTARSRFFSAVFSP